ncbi:Uncharacterised protein [Lysinibacillus capsici]|uniref:Uncharacterized protein n=1 Tax=Lysinibacillus capsici TaxID=2115968 RepID=A0A2X1A653_9BACI|nr:hypothetical protein [Lysinibacillus capsici]SPU40648.1 Uncharacterised protein [Lysinibacillus capsici]
MSKPVVLVIILAASLLITIAAIYIGINSYVPAADAAKTSQTEFSTLATEVKEQKYMAYDNQIVSGSIVINALRKFQKDAESQQIALYVETGKNGKNAGTWYFSTFDKSSSTVTLSGTSDLSLTTKATDANYVNPSGLFDTVIERDKNNVVRALRFIQR